MCPLGDLDFEAVQSVNGTAAEDTAVRKAPTIRLFPPDELLQSDCLPL
jgi:hypothetical protein